MTKVVFIDGSALQLEGYTNRDGVIEGDVVNGSWHAAINTIQKLLYVDGVSAPRPYTKLVEVEIPKNIASRGYNRVIDWAEKQFGEPAAGQPSEEEMERLQDSANRDMAAAKGMTLGEFKKWSKEQMRRFHDDEDIPF
jgi:hypothetical protein